MIRSDGRIDTPTLPTSLVEALLDRDPTLANGPVERQPRIGTNEPETRVVQPGESLAAIAGRFCGSTVNYPAIFDANRDTPASPDGIRVGQGLVIPAL